MNVEIRALTPDLEEDSGVSGFRQGHFHRMV